MSDPQIAPESNTHGDAELAQNIKVKSNSNSARRGVLTFAVTAVATAALASGLIFGGLAVFGSQNGTVPSNTSNTTNADPGKDKSGSSTNQRGDRTSHNNTHSENQNGNGGHSQQKSDSGDGDTSGQGAAKAKAARDRAVSAAKSAAASSHH